MKHVIHGDIVLSHAPTGPLAAHLARFATAATAQGYSHYSRYRQVLLGACDRIGATLARSASSSGSYVTMASCPRRGTARTGRRQSPGWSRPERFLRHERALAPMTVGHYLPFVHRFLTDRFGTSAVRWSRVSAGEVVHFVQR